MLKNWISLTLNILFPQKCMVCDKGRELICLNCAQKTKNAEPTKLGNIFSAANYHDPVIKKSIWLLKYRGVKSIAKPLSDLILSRLALHLEIESPSDLEVGLPSGGSPTSKLDEWLIIPIPLSKKRLKERGYNQTELLAKSISDKTKIPLVLDVLYKNRHTETQVSIKNKAARIENLKNVFSVKNRGTIRNKNIILVDDVTTTGTTIAEATKTLRVNGAQKVLALTVARD